VVHDLCLPMSNRCTTDYSLPLPPTEHNEIIPTHTYLKELSARSAAPLRSLSNPGEDYSHV
jgi:hypothetical protein